VISCAYFLELFDIFENVEKSNSSEISSFVYIFAADNLFTKSRYFPFVPITNALLTLSLK
jgi:hypothetical protein